MNFNICILLYRFDDYISEQILKELMLLYFAAKKHLQIPWCITINMDFRVLQQSLQWLKHKRSQVFSVADALKCSCA